MIDIIHIKNSDNVCVFHARCKYPKNMYIHVWGTGTHKTKENSNRNLHHPKYLNENPLKFFPPQKIIVYSHSWSFKYTFQALEIYDTQKPFFLFFFS